MSVGILMLDTRFPRPRGDIGNPQSFPWPVLYETVRGATVDRIVGSPDAALLEPFIQAGRRLIARGASVISTSCGFLVLWQEAMQKALGVPVVSSSLLLLPQLERAGVLTFDAGALGAAHFAAAGAKSPTPVEGLDPRSELYRAIREDRARFDPRAAENAVAEAGVRLVAAHPELVAIVLECTNFGPYREALAQRTGRQVFGIVEALGIMVFRTSNPRGSQCFD